MAMVADEERRMISKRTRDALAAAKRRGTKLGGIRHKIIGEDAHGNKIYSDRGVVPSKKARALAVEVLQARSDAKAADLAPIIAELHAAGKTSLRAIAEGLNGQGIPTVRGGKWSSPQLMRMLERLP
jgi:DNA invertase Pin-like site-specific DNA recombinase